MIDTDPFSQFIIVPDDRPVLPPVDEDVSGLKDLSSLGFQGDFPIDQDSEPSGGLLLGLDTSHTAPQRRSTFDVIALSQNGGESAFFPTSDPSSSYAGLFPPALSPDTSPISVASSSWPQTPGSDPTLANINSTPADVLWDIEEESGPTTHFLDQSGNSLEDIPSQMQDVMPEDIACTPQIVPNTSLLVTTPHMVHSDIPIFVVSPLPGTSTSLQAESVPFGQASCTSFPPPSPHTSQSLSFEFSPVTGESPLSACSMSPSLSPLTAISFFSQSSPDPSPLIDYSPLSPAISSVPLSECGEKVEDSNSIWSAPTEVTMGRLRKKRNVDDLDKDAPLSKIPRRTKGKNVDEEEWSPGSERVKRPRIVSSSQSARQRATSILLAEGSDSTTSRDLEGNPETAPTTCGICGQGFTRASDYVRHIQNSASHPETRKVWPCPYCDGALGRKDALGRHIRTLHPGKPVFIPEGISGSQLSEGRKEPAVQQMGQRKMPLRRQPRKDARTRYP